MHNHSPEQQPQSSLDRVIQYVSGMPFDEAATEPQSITRFVGGREHNTVTVTKAPGVASYNIDLHEAASVNGPAFSHQDGADMDFTLTAEGRILNTPDQPVDTIDPQTEEITALVLATSLETSTDRPLGSMARLMLKLGFGAK